MEKTEERDKSERDLEEQIERLRTEVEYLKRHSSNMRRTNGYCAEDYMEIGGKPGRALVNHPRWKEFYGKEK